MFCVGWRHLFKYTPETVPAVEAAHAGPAHKAAVKVPSVGHDTPLTSIACLGIRGREHYFLMLIPIIRHSESHRKRFVIKSNSEQLFLLLTTKDLKEIGRMQGMRMRRDGSRDGDSGSNWSL